MWADGIISKKDGLGWDGFAEVIGMGGRSSHLHDYPLRPRAGESRNVVLKRL